MSNANLPFTRFRSQEGRSPVPRVQRPGALGTHEPELPPTPAEGRILRVRRMPRADAEAELAHWAVEGAVRLDAPAGWVALERTRADAVTGLPRRLRIAAGPGDPADVLNFSALEPLGREDEAVWHASVGRLRDERPPPPAASPGGGPGGGDGHEWAA